MWPFKGLRKYKTIKILSGGVDWVDKDYTDTIDITLLEDQYGCRKISVYGSVWPASYLEINVGRKALMWKNKEIDI